MKCIHFNELISVRKDFLFIIDFRYVVQLALLKQ